MVQDKSHASCRHSRVRACVMTSLVGLRKGIAYGNNASLRERLLALFLEIGGWREVNCFVCDCLIQPVLILLILKHRHSAALKVCSLFSSVSSSGSSSSHSDRSM